MDAYWESLFFFKQENGGLELWFCDIRFTFYGLWVYGLPFTLLWFIGLFVFGFMALWLYGFMVYGGLVYGFAPTLKGVFKSF